MEYAIISLHNKQFLVKPGSTITMLGILGAEGDIIKDAKVMIYKDEKLEIGTPFTDHSLDLKIITLNKTEKVDIFKFKSKSRYRRHTGHRQDQTILEVVAKAEAKAKPAAKVKPATKTKVKPKTATKTKTKTVKEK